MLTINEKIFKVDSQWITYLNMVSVKIVFTYWTLTPHECTRMPERISNVGMYPAGIWNGVHEFQHLRFPRACRYIHAGIPIPSRLREHSYVKKRCITNEPRDPVWPYRDMLFSDCLLWKFSVNKFGLEEVISKYIYCERIIAFYLVKKELGLFGFIRWTPIPVYSFTYIVVVLIFW